MYPSKIEKEVFASNIISNLYRTLKDDPNAISHAKKGMYKINDNRIERVKNSWFSFLFRKQEITLFDLRVNLDIKKPEFLRPFLKETESAKISKFFDEILISQFGWTPRASHDRIELTRNLNKIIYPPKKAIEDPEKVRRTLNNDKFHHKYAASTPRPQSRLSEDPSIEAPKPYLSLREVNQHLKKMVDASNPAPKRQEDILTKQSDLIDQLKISAQSCHTNPDNFVLRNGVLEDRTDDSRFIKLAKKIVDFFYSLFFNQGEELRKVLDKSSPVVTHCAWTRAQMKAILSDVLERQCPTMEKELMELFSKINIERAPSVEEPVSAPIPNAPPKIQIFEIA